MKRVRLTRRQKADNLALSKIMSTVDSFVNPLHSSSMFCKDIEEKKKWMLDVSYRDGFWAGFLFDRKARPAKMPLASALGLNIELDSQFEQGEKDGRKANRK